MIRRFLTLGLPLALAAAFIAASTARTHAAEPEPRRLVKANVLPLALEDGFQFRKQQLLLHDPSVVAKTRDKMISFEHERIEFGAVTEEERRARYGHYFTFWWRTERPANLIVRLEYRQANLGAYVQAQEVDFNAAKAGTYKSEFSVIGDDYEKEGRITSWRAILIENGRIVGLTQSALWH